MIPQRWSACRGYARGLRVDPDVIENPPDLHALGDEGNQANLSTALGEQQRKNQAFSKEHGGATDCKPTVF